jgi:hypothetical protein
MEKYEQTPEMYKQIWKYSYKIVAYVSITIGGIVCDLQFLRIIIPMYTQCFIYQIKIFIIYYSQLGLILFSNALL